MHSNDYRFVTRFCLIIQANHRRAMRMSNERLKRELARWHASAPEAEADVPEPPQPTSPPPATMTIGMAGIWLGLGMAAAVLYRLLQARCRSRRNNNTAPTGAL